MKSSGVNASEWEVIRAMATIVHPGYTIPERIIVGAVKIMAWSFEWLIKACLEKLCEHDEDCFV